MPVHAVLPRFGKKDGKGKEGCGVALKQAEGTVRRMYERMLNKQAYID
jgi:hypothetical protein